MIKGLSLLMHRMEHHLSAGIRHHIYYLVQKFVQTSMRDSIRKAVKGKKLQTKTYVYILTRILYFCVCLFSYILYVCVIVGLCWSVCVHCIMLLAREKRT